MSFASDLLGSVQDQQTRKTIMQVLRRYQGRCVYIPEIGKRARERHSARMAIDSGMSHKDVIRLLIDRYSISYSTARRILHKSKE